MKLLFYASSMPCKNDYKTAHIIVFAAIVSAWIPSTFAGESNGGGNSRPSAMEDVIKEHEKQKKEWEFARRTGMSTAKAERIRELSAANTQESRDELMKWFKSLPQAEPASDARQAERTVVVKALAGMMPLPEFKAFGLGVLNTEINALREAKKLEQENYYPRDLIFATFESLVRGSPEQDIVDTLSTYAQDRNVASDVRARFKAFLTERQFQQDGPRDLDGYTGVKRDYLIFLATDTLFKHLSRSGTLSDSERECLKPLRRLIDTMPDSGAFSWRHRAAGNLNTIYEKLGVDEKVRYVTDPSVDEPSERNNVR